MTDWSIRIAPCGARAETWRIDANGALRFSDTLALLENDAAFRRFFTAALAKSRWPAFFWETPAITTATIDREFEVTLTDAPALTKITADRGAFGAHFDAATDDVIVFPNLSGDAVLVVPCPVSRADAYGHLAAFVRRAPAAQIDHLWRTLAVAASAKLSEAPTWINTAGTGVPWLHLRLDTAPKYYRHLPYKHRG